jgi:protoporphyrinogen oxidase
MVVNLYYSEPDLVPVRGFGYLIPRTIPFVQNPERALGVIFDSDAMKGQDDAPGTKLTVMLGGHWWDGWTSYPDEEEAIVMARMILSRHLKISMDVKPEVAKATLQKNCIPQYTVGHFDRMRTAHSQIKRIFDGRLRVAGNSYTGVGVKDCIKSAWQVVDGIVEGRGSTGLERFQDQPKWDRVRPIKIEDSKS